MSKRPSPHIVPPEQLSDALLDLLAAGPTTVDDLARRTGYSSNAVRERLSELRHVGLVHRLTQPRSGGGMHYVWRAGTATGRIPILQKAHDASSKGVGQPHQATVRDFAPFHYRDPLVAALFGSAHKEAA